MSLRCAVLAAVLSAAWPATAQVMREMGDAPSVHFTKEDHKIFNAAMQDALEKGADGEIRAWSNPDTNARGELTLVKSFERKGQQCRRMSIANKAKGRSGLAEYNFCKQVSGQWSLAN